METQLEIFPVIKKMPEWLHEYFHKANAGDYGYKHNFYSLIKPYILKTFGEFVGYDLQIIEYKCRSCNGTGVYKQYQYEFGQRYLIKSEPCWNCKNGIYLTKDIVLERWIVNGVAYHTPLSEHVVCSYQNIIKGKIEHEHIDSDEAIRAYLILLWMYNKSAFYNHLKEYAMIKIKGVKDTLTSLIRRDNTKDELPF